MNLPELTPREFEIVGHSLGIHPLSCKSSKKKRDKRLPDEFYRNHFCASEGHSDLPTLLSLENKGYMERGNQWFFAVTELGEFKFRSHFKKYIQEPL